MPARQKKPKSAAFLAWEKAKKDYDTAAKGNDEAKKKSAKTHLAECASKVARERFVDVGGARAGKAVDAINMLANVSNRRSYNYTQADTDKIMAALNAAVSHVANSFKTALAGSATEKTGKTKLTFE